MFLLYYKHGDICNIFKSSVTHHCVISHVRVNKETFLYTHSRKTLRNLKEFEVNTSNCRQNLPMSIYLSHLSVPLQDLKKKIKMFHKVTCKVWFIQENIKKHVYQDKLLILY